MPTTPLSPKALFFGAIHMDRLGRLNEMAIAGSSNPGRVDEVAGGASLNSASVARLLGLDCSILGLVGDDQNGEFLRQVLADRDIGDLLSTKENCETGSYTAILEPDGNLVIALADLGLNERITPEVLVSDYKEILTNSNIWFLNANLSQYTLEALCGPQFPCRPEILSAATISPAKAQHLVSSLPHLDLLFTNLSEANAIIFEEEMVAPQKKLDAENCVNRLRALGVTQGTLSQGSEALWVWDRNQVSRFLPSKIDNLVDVTGAGDALAAVFLAGLAKGKTMAECAPGAIAAAQMTIRVKGPYNKFINDTELKILSERVTQIS